MYLIICKKKKEKNRFYSLENYKIVQNVVHSFGVCNSFFSIDLILMHLARSAIIVRMAPRNETMPKTTSTINQFLKLPILSPKSQLQFSLSFKFNAEKFTGLREINLKSSCICRLLVEFCAFFMNLYDIV